MTEATSQIAMAQPRLRQLAAPLLFAVLVALGGQIRVPIPGSPVPLTLQVVFVLLAGALLTPAAAATSMVLFVGAGILGAPIFSGGGAGVAYLAGPTGGYLAGFVAGAAVCALVLGGRRDSFGRTCLAMAAGVITIHLCGVAHLMLYLGGDFMAAIRAGALPFLPMDILKVGVAASVVTGASSLWPSLGRRSSQR